MNKIILEARNKQELEEKLKRTINLNEDETYTIKEIKKPFSFLFISINGKYEISILKKNELQKIEKNIKIQDEVLKKTEKRQEDKNKLEENVKNKVENFIKVTGLNIKVISITKKSNVLTVNLDGKDVRYFIGEKGIALSSLEYLFNLIKEFKNYRIYFDSNSYKQKREEALKNLAHKKAQKVISTKLNYKLNPMTARERRIIHEVISEYENLATESYGEEPKRYLVIKYVGN